MLNRNVVFELHGGIGNQLFQFAAGNAYATKMGYQVNYDVTHILNNGLRRSRIEPKRIPLLELGLSVSQVQGGVFKLLIERIIRKCPILREHFKHNVMTPSLFRKTFESTETGFDSRFLDIRASKFFGYFQTYKYCSETLRQSLTSSLFNREEPLWVKEMLSEIESSKILIMHARFFQKETDGIYMNLDSDYYVNAIAAQGGDNWFDQIWLFSNDINKAQEMLSNESLKRVRLIQQPESVDDLSILHIMASSKYLIIANSTFSWWGAYLGFNQKSIIGPKEIFLSKKNPIDYYPPEWVLV
jgi:hypothetical protein